MDRLWTPWRYQYVSAAADESRQGVPEALRAWPGDCNCVFCNLVASADYAAEHGMSREDAERAAHIVVRGQRVFVVLNAYPYTSGHVMVVPYEHQPSLAGLPVETAAEMMDMARRVERTLNAVYKPHGINLGMNLGEAAGAGIMGHLHLHALPRWFGDTNFMTVVGETRVLPEDLDVTWRRLREGYASVEKE